MNGPLDYAPPPRRGPVSFGGKAVVAVGIAITLLLIAALLPSLNQGHPHYSWQACSSNLKQIGQAILLYANENRDAMPPDFVALMETEDLVPEVFVCRSTDDVKTAATRPFEQRADFSAGGHCSYVYVDDLRSYSKLSASDIVAFEPAGHHDGLCNVLFGDGHVEQVGDAAAKEIARQHAAGVRPLRLPAR